MSSNVFPSDYERFIFTSRYARWLPEFNRRENWSETVDRYCEFMFKHVRDTTGFEVDSKLATNIWEAIHNFEVMPSMRAMMTAGEALDRDNTAGYNCAYMPVDDIRSFDEAMYILMCGTGVGFSVEQKYVNKLPTVADKFYDGGIDSIIVADSKEGWAMALRELIMSLYSGVVPSWNLSLIRPAGARLKTFGGRASGPKPLNELFEFVVEKFKGAKGRKLTSLECHDIMCKIGAIVVVGGVRRSAMISLSDLEDAEMRTAKSGEWWKLEGQRALANNSVAYSSKPPIGTFMEEWLALYNSHSGERGIFNRQASLTKALENGRRDSLLFEYGTNPCSEIILRPYQFCNLTETVIRAYDSIADLRRKVRTATVLGTLQSTLTHFPYLRKEWVTNTAEERLLGVSLTGIMDNDLTNGHPLFITDLPDLLRELREVAITTNKLFANALGIPVSAAITCVKPSGTVSQLVDSASGIHARYSRHYIRSVRADNKDPLTKFMQSSGIPSEPDVTKPNDITVFYFPKQAPSSAVVTTERTAIQQLELWLLYQRHWCEHKPSVTINVREHEWVEVGAWVYKHFDEVSGVSFLPYDDHVYAQAPYVSVDEYTYHTYLDQMPKEIDWSKLSLFEKEDNTVNTQTLACSADGCEVVDLVG